MITARIDLSGLKLSGIYDLNKLQKHLGLEVMRIRRPYVPMDTSALSRSAKLMNNNTILEYNTPYARLMWYGVIYVDPLTGASGFLTDNGWKSRKGITKIPATVSIARPSHLPTEFTYGGGNLRGAFWTERAWAVDGDKVVSGIAKGIEKGVFK